MANAVTFDLFARDRASSAFTKVGKASEDAGKKVRGLNTSFGAITAGSRGLRTSFGLIGKGAALAAGAAGIGGLIEGFKGVYSEAREAQKVSAQTAAVLKSTGGIAHVSAAQVGDLATAISNKVGVDDEAIQSGANLLLTFKGIRNEAGRGNDIFNQATRTVTDMAAAMNQGKVTTDGLKTSSIQIGKALNDPIKGITALTKVGVTFTDQQKKQIKAMVASGDTLGAQKVILRELNSEFAGSAAAGTTASQKLGVVFGNIKESIGTALLPAIDSVSTWLANVLPGALKVASSVAGPIFKTLGDGFAGLAAAFSGEGISSDGFVGVMETIGDSARTALTWLQQTFVPGVVQVFKDLGTKIKENLPTIDLSGLATSFKEQAVKWGGDIISGVRTGLATGDWSQLGQTVGQGVLTAIGAAAGLVKKIAAKIGELLGKVDWFDVGEAVGKTAFPFLVGFVNTLTDGIFKVAKEHPFDTALFVVSFLGIGKIGGVIAKVLEKIPIARAFAPLFRGIASITKPINDAIGGVVSRTVRAFGKGFIEGLRVVFPGISKDFLAHLRNLPTYIGVVTLELVAKARQMLASLAKAILDTGPGAVGRAIGKVIGRIIEPFAKAGSWLVRKGIDIMSGLLVGISRGFVAVARWLGGIGARILAHFGRAAVWLLSKGREVIGGLLNGITGKYRDLAVWLSGIGGRIIAWFRNAPGWLKSIGSQILQGLLQGATNALSGVGNWIKNIGNRIIGAVKSFFKISSPSKVMMGLGGHLVTGLIQGMLAQNPTALVGKVFGGMTGALRTLFTKGLLGDVASFGAKALGALGSLAGGVGNLALGKATSFGSVEKMVQGYASLLYGWSGSQWTALRALIMGESGFNPNAQNPTSSAYGLGQFLNSTWGFVGFQKTSDPGTQARAMLKYIKMVYDNPVNAFSAWLNRSPHWYGAGLPPTVFSQPTLIGVGERGAETVSVIPHNRPGMLRSGGRGGNTYNINVAVPLGANPREVGRQLVEAIRAYEKGSGAVLVRS